MLVKEIIQRIQSLYSKGVHSDDSRLSNRHIYNKMLTLRSKLISREVKKKQKISQWNYQTIPCIELEKAPIHECPCIPPLGCEILKSKFPIPEPLTGLGMHLIQSVTSLDGTVLYGETNWTAKKYKAANKFTASNPDFYIRNNFLYVTGDKRTKIVTMTALFEDPQQVETFPQYCCEDVTPTDSCYSILDSEFPMDNDLIDTMIEMAVNELIIIFNGNNEDLTNNTADNVGKQSK